MSRFRRTKAKNLVTNVTICLCALYLLSNEVFLQMNEETISCLPVSGSFSCDDHLQAIKQQVEAEILLSREKASPSVDCSPQTIKIPCSDLANTSLQCMKAFVVEKLDYRSQFDCLTKIVDRVKAKSESEVPRLLHLVWFYGKSKSQLDLREYIAIVSVLRYFRPVAVFLWNDGNLPSGKWWNELISQLNQPPDVASEVVKRKFLIHVSKEKQFALILSI